MTCYAGNFHKLRSAKTWPGKVRPAWLGVSSYELGSYELGSYELSGFGEDTVAKLQNMSLTGGSGSCNLFGQTEWPMDCGKAAVIYVGVGALLLVVLWNMGK